MITAYETFTHTAQWQRKTGDSPYGGISTYAPAVTIPTRRRESLKLIAGDVTSNVQHQTLPEHTVHPGDLLDDAEVLEVASVQDGPGNTLWWVAYARA